jgi:hypothetical protein
VLINTFIDYYQWGNCILCRRHSKHDHDDKEGGRGEGERESSSVEPVTICIPQHSESASWPVGEVRSGRHMRMDLEWKTGS